MSFFYFVCICWFRLKFSSSFYILSDFLLRSTHAHLKFQAYIYIFFSLYKSYHYHLYVSLSMYCFYMEFLIVHSSHVILFFVRHVTLFYFKQQDAHKRYSYIIFLRLYSRLHHVNTQRFKCILKYNLALYQPHRVYKMHYIIWVKIALTPAVAYTCFVEHCI